MRRSVFLTIMALGAVITLLGATGIVAVFTDTAETPTNTFGTGPRASSADIKVAQTTSITTDPGCSNQTFADNFVNFFFNTTDGQPYAFSQATKLFCIKNVGSAAVALKTTTTDVLDVETDCTNDESTVDTTCGSSGAGEISPLVFLLFTKVDCGTGSDAGTAGVDDVAGMTSTPVTLSASVAPTAVACFKVELIYDPSAPSDVVAAQTDRVTWKQIFTATA